MFVGKKNVYYMIRVYIYIYIHIYLYECNTDYPDGTTKPLFTGDSF